MEIYYVYITKKGKLIYKRLKCDNLILENKTNSYGHKLILKTNSNQLKWY